MNIKKIQFINEIMTEQMNHWLLYPLILTVMGVCRAMAGIGEPFLAMWALCSLIPLAFFLFRCKLKNLILFALAHLGVAALVFAASGADLLTRIVCVACVIGYVIHSFLLRLKEQSVYSNGFPLPFGVVVSAAASLFQYYQGTRGWENYYHFTLIACIALYFIIYYVDHYLDFLSMNKSSAGFLPAAEMFHSGMGLVLVYTLLGIGILLFSTQFEWLADILRPIKDLLLRFLRFLFSRAPQGGEEIAPVEEAMPQGGMGDMGFPEGGESFWLWEVLEHVMMAAFVIALLAGAGVLLWKLFKLIQKYMTFRYQEEGVETSEAFDLREKCGIEKDTQRKAQGLFSALSPRERVRKLYKKRLSAAARAQAQDGSGLDARTAREWARTLSLDGMADIYEKARYTDQEISNADVKRMKEAWK